MRHDCQGSLCDSKSVDDFRFSFAYALCMAFMIPDAFVCDFAVRCKGCGESIPAPVQTLPSSWIVAGCPLCHEERRYLPDEIFRGRLSHKLPPRLLIGRSGIWGK